MVAARFAFYKGLGGRLNPGFDGGRWEILSMEIITKIDGGATNTSSLTSISQ